MHNNLSGPTKVVCYREVLLLREFVVSGSFVYEMSCSLWHKVNYSGLWSEVTKPQHVRMYQDNQMCFS